MTKALSIDLRERVVAVIEGGLSRRQAAARFGVSVSSAIRWHALARRTGTAIPRRRGGDRRSGRIETHADIILGAVAKQPDITLTELRELLAGHGVAVGIATLYVAPLVPVPGTTGVAGGYVGTSKFLQATWGATPNLTLAASLVHMSAASAIPPSPC